MAKTNTKATTAKAKQPAPTPMIPNRYHRAAAVIIEFGTGTELDLDELAVRCGFSKATASYCLAAYEGITQALKDAKLLPTKKPADKRAPVVPRPQEVAEKGADTEPAVA